MTETKNKTRSFTKAAKAAGVSHLSPQKAAKRGLWWLPVLIADVVAHNEDNPKLFHFSSKCAIIPQKWKGSGFLRKLLTFVCGFALAVAALIYFLDGVFWLALPICAGGALLLFLAKKKLCRRLAIFCLGLTVGILWCSGYTTFRLRGLDTFVGKPASVLARAVEYSSDTVRGHRVTADLLVDNRKICTNFYFEEDITLQPGDVFSCTAELRRASLEISEGEDLYDISRGVYLTGNAEELSVQETQPSFSTRLLRFSNRLRENLYSVFPEDSAGYFSALTTGDRSGMSYSFRNRLMVAGLYHAVSLSGMHVSILLSTIIVFCMGRKRLAACLGIPVIILFCLMSGGSPATLRAAYMQTLLLACLFVSREYDPLTALAAALLFLLLENPWALAHWGLQLSFTSSAGILLLMPRFTAIPIRSKLLRGLVQPLFVTLSATVLSGPLMSAYFGMHCLVAPITNLLSLWAVTVSFVGGIVISLLAFLSMPAAQFLAKGFDLLYRWLKLVTDVSSSLPFAAVYKDTPLLLAWSYLAYLLLTAGLLLRPRWWLCPSCAAVTLGLCLLLTQPIPDGLTALDVGQGQCLLLKAGEDTVLVDCGGAGNETGELAARHLLSRGITELDAVVLTHFDADHCDGTVQLLNRIPAGAVYVQSWKEESPLRDEITAVTDITPVTNRISLPLEEMSVTLLPAIGGNSTNNKSVCVLASCRECDILVTGDLNAKAEARLVTDYDLPDLEVLIAGHHGAAESTGVAILDALRPETVLVSVGQNSFGHPDPGTLKRITASGAVCYTTQENGNLFVGW